MREHGPEAAAAHGASVRIAAYYACIFLTIGVQLPYLPAMLDARGLGAGEIAIVLAMPMFIRMLTTPLVGYVSDRTGNRARVAAVLAALAGGAALVMLLAPGKVALATASVLFAIALMAGLPLVDTIAVAHAAESGRDYGRMRLWGSIAFIGASIGAGRLIDWAGAGSIAPLLAVTALLTALAAAILPRRAASAASVDPAIAGAPAAIEAGSAWRAFARPSFVLFLVAVGLIQASHMLYYGFSVIEWQRQGLSAGLIGALWSLGVAAEILLFAFSRRVIALTGPMGLILIGATGGIVRWAALSMDPPLAVIVVAQALHALSFGATHLGAVHALREAVPSAWAGTAQALHSTVAAGAIAGLVQIGSGPLYAQFAGGGYLAMAMLCGIGLGILLALGREPVSLQPR